MGVRQLGYGSDKVYQLLAHGRWFSPGTPASSTTETDRHDIAEILLKVALKHKKINQSNQSYILKTLSLAAVSRVHPFCNLQSRARTHPVLVIGLYELLDPTT
jgi:hypothetical protein